MDKQTLKNMLMLYGADMTQWPQEEREPACKLLLERPEFSQLVEEQAEFDALAGKRPVLRENPVFAQNIIAMAAAEDSAREVEQTMARQRDMQTENIRGIWGELLGIFTLSKPAYALMACAVLGFSLGVFSSTISTTEVVSQDNESEIELSYFDAMSGMNEAGEIEEGYDMGDWL